MYDASDIKYLVKSGKSYRGTLNDMLERNSNAYNIKLIEQINIYRARKKR